MGNVLVAESDTESATNSQMSETKPSSPSIAPVRSVQNGLENQTITEKRGVQYCRVPSPIRTQGDGMESTLAPQENLQGCTTTTPKGQRKVLSPPVHTDKLNCIVIHGSKKDAQIIIGNKKVKEPRFVPYEPYKCAVKPMLPQENKRKISVEVCPQALDPRLNRLSKSPVTENIPETPEYQVKAMSKEMERLKEEKVVLEEQLRIQVQVNGELKKLLVASVGEDLQARVSFLTEDKAKLAQDILRYTQRLSADHEEKDRLGIQCDVWRSKFLASSLMVDELARWKATLLCRFEEMRRAMVATSEEYAVMRAKADATYRNLKMVQEHMDHDQNELKKVIHLLDLAEDNHSLSESLLQSLTRKASVSLSSDKPSTDFVPAEAQTPAERLTNQILSSSPMLPCDNHDLACFMVTGAGNQLCPCGSGSHMLGQVAYQCCPHCTGEVKMV